MQIRALRLANETTREGVENSTGQWYPHYVIRGYTVEARSVRRSGQGSVDSSRLNESPSDSFPCKEVGVDWITVTCSEGDTRSQFDQVGYELLSAEARSGNEVKPWSMRGFEGLNGGHITI